MKGNRLAAANRILENKYLNSYVPGFGSRGIEQKAQDEQDQEFLYHYNKLFNTQFSRNKICDVLNNIVDDSRMRKSLIKSFP